MKPPAPDAPPAPTIADLQREIQQLRQQYRAVTQYLWIAIRLFRPEDHEAELVTNEVDPLWEVAFVHVQDAKGVIDPNRIRILAGTQLPMTEQEKKRLVRRLRGTSDRLAAVMAELKLNFPHAYVEQFIADRVKWKVNTDGSTVWESVTPPGFVEKLKNALDLPKK